MIKLNQAYYVPLGELRDQHTGRFKTPARNTFGDNRDLPVHIQEQYIGRVYHHSY